MFPLCSSTVTMSDKGKNAPKMKNEIKKTSSLVYILTLTSTLHNQYSVDKSDYIPMTSFKRFDARLRNPVMTVLISGAVSLFLLLVHIC